MPCSGAEPYDTLGGRISNAEMTSTDDINSARTLDSGNTIDKARTLYMSGDLEAAKQAYAAALASGGSLDLCNLGLGLIALDRQELDDAIRHLTVAAQSEDSVEARIALSLALTKADRFEEALIILEKTAALFPNDSAVWRLKGKTELKCARRTEALDSFLKAHALTPQDTNILNDLGVTCRALKRYADAESYYRQAITLNPSLSVAYANLGNVLELQDRSGEAEQALRAALKLNPRDQDAAYNLATLLIKLERPQEAGPVLESLLSTHPKRWDALTNLAVCKLHVGDLKGAETDLNRALKMNPDNTEAHYNLAWLLLLTGRHQQGWQELEWRWNLDEFSKRAFSIPAWSGEPLKGRTLLLHAEQGLGDTIQFSRFISDIPKGNGRIVLECQPPLVDLLKDLPGLDGIVPAGTTLPPADVHTPLLSLPRVLGYTGARTAASLGYLSAPSHRPHALTLADSGKRRIGVVWAGSPDNKIEGRRKVSIESFLSLFDSTDADFVALQVGPRGKDIAAFPDHRIIFQCENKVRTFADTATVVDQLDLVIGVDTSVIHLSAAMGKPTWVLLPFMPDYRWGLGAETTPWYDSMRLFRQTERGDWRAVFRQIGQALRSW